MDVWELIYKVRETVKDFGGIWPSTYSQLEEELERHFAAFEQSVADEAAEHAYNNGFDDGYDAGYDAGSQYDD